MSKLVLALIMAAMMIVSSVSALAADPAVGTLNINGTLTVDGLDKGDIVKYYQVVQWQETEPQGWIWGADIKSGHTLTGAELEDITDDGAISSALASKIGQNVTGGTDGGTVGDSKKWTADVTKAGLYMVVVTPAESGTMYNPIFVAANWYGNDEEPDSSNSIKVSENEKTYSDKGMAKKSTIPLDKESKGNSTETTTNKVDDNDADHVDVGETVQFVVTTTIPKFAENYTHPVFKLVDKLSAGLELDTTSVKVYKAKEDGETKDGDFPAANYTVNPVAKTGYTLTIAENYLWGKTDPAIPVTGQKIIIEYSAKVTGDAEKIINQEKNTVDLIFSNEPTDTEGHGLKRDETNHFSFSIDANLLGDEYSEESSTEAVKVGVDKDGNPIVSEKSYKYNNGVKHAALEGAEFKLYLADGTTPYTNDIYPQGVTVYSDASGRINIRGLDVGDYVLKETKAPTGYIKMQVGVKVKIEANIEEEDVTDTETINGKKVEVTYKTNKLVDYSVTFGNGKTTYTISNSKAEVIKTSRSVSSSDSELANTKGVELPSTGGMGTTIFYVGGSILVLAAAILLVTKRRMGVED